MRKLTSAEKAALEDAKERIAEGAIASMKIEGEPLPENLRACDLIPNLSPEQDYSLAVNLGIIEK